MAKLSADAHAKSIDGTYFFVLNTHSMEPTIHGGDYVVIDKRRRYESIVAGEIGSYYADWYTAHPVTHRFTTKDSGGWIMSGDNNQYSEARWRVTPKNYIGIVAGIYRVKP